MVTTAKYHGYDSYVSLLRIITLIDISLHANYILFLLNMNFLLFFSEHELLIGFTEHEFLIVFSEHELHELNE